MKNHKHLCKAESQRRIISAALYLAARDGYQQVTRASVATAADIAPATVSFHYSTMTQFRRALMRAAIEQRVLAVIAQGLAVDDPYALAAPVDLRALAADSLKG